VQEQVPANALEKLLPVLVHIQANLDEDLSLDAVAKRVRLSSFHFHRLFRSAIGETLKQYTQRLRLERAANRLIIHDSTILDVALDSGFQSHETFSREFKRRFQSYAARLPRVGSRKAGAKLGVNTPVGRDVR
jgi:transcriptional regulator GlxA family with amidase domain